MNEEREIHHYPGTADASLAFPKVISIITPATTRKRTPSWSFDEANPYFRGMIGEIGLPHYELFYDQPRRVRGITKNNLYTLYDYAMLGITNLSKVPLRLATFLGFLCAGFSILAAFGYFIYKLAFWNNFSVGTAPLVIGLFFLGSVQLVSMGILGEYVGAIHTEVFRRPHVVDKERLKFEYPPGEPLQEDLESHPTNAVHDFQN
jgi:hypothetical protein